MNCQAQSPETESEYTLISAQYGWRLARSKARDGTLLLEWRCPSCWAKYKAAQPGTGDAPPASHERATIPAGESSAGTRQDSREPMKRKS